MVDDDVSICSAHKLGAKKGKQLGLAIYGFKLLQLL